LTETTQANTFSLFDKGVFIYLLKGSLAGLFLGATTYSAQLFTEIGNESKAVGIQSQASVKVGYYKELKELAEDNENLEVLKTFNDKYKLAYELVINEEEIAKNAVSQASKNMALVTSIINLIFIVSGAIFVISGGFLIIKSSELNRDLLEFTLRNTQIDLVRDSLNKEVKAVTNNKKVCNKTILRHKALLNKLPKGN
jgi:ABC-type multidrug transport system fused ATPase/permease subunit